jgi:hypothetical protein
MKNIMVVNYNREYHPFGYLEPFIKAQIDNSLEIGWKPEDIIIISNIGYEYMGIKTVVTSLNDFCITGSKMFGIQYIFNKMNIKDTIFCHDIDCWQNIWFDCPDFKDVGISQYSSPKFNGGSIFWKYTAKDIIEEIINKLVSQKEKKEEPTLNKVLKNQKYIDRVTVLNNTYNVGCSGFVKRYLNSIRPVKVCHLHPTNKIAWETHTMDRNAINARSVSYRLEKIIRKYFPKLAIELSEEGKKKRLLNIEKNKNIALKIPEFF